MQYDGPCTGMVHVPEQQSELLPQLSPAVVQQTVPPVPPSRAPQPRLQQSVLLVHAVPT